MSVQLAKDEKVIRSFTYAAVGYNKKKDRYDTFKSLVVTNKRIIHESVRETRNNELILRQEMPVADAKFVKTSMGKTASPEFLVQAIVLGVIAAIIIFLSTLEFAAKFSFALWGVAAILVVLGVMRLVAYFGSLSSVVSFSIFTDHELISAMGTSASESDHANAVKNKNKKSNQEPSLEIRVNADVARDIANGLGAAILDAIAYKEEPIATEKPCVCAEELPLPTPEVEISEEPLALEEEAAFEEIAEEIPEEVEQ